MDIKYFSFLSKREKTRYAKWKENLLQWSYAFTRGIVGIKWYVPEYKFDTEILKTFSKAITRVSNDSSSTDEVFKPKEYAIYDAYFNWHPSKNITLTASILNIFERRYFKWPMFSTYYKNHQDNVKATNPLELQTALSRSFGIDAILSF